LIEVAQEGVAVVVNGDPSGRHVLIDLFLAAFQRSCQNQR
jgi:hypothetical protein